MMRGRFAIAVAAFSTFAPLHAMAEDAEAAPLSHSAPLWERDVLSGDWGGTRSTWEQHGYRLGLNATTEVFSVASGGVSRGTVYEDLIEAVLDVDLEKAFGWSGGLFHANGYLTHGQGPSSHHLGNNLLTLSNIEADRGDRLFDLYVQQSFFKGALSLRIGQIAAAEEFFVSRTAALFLNGTYGWPAAMSVNLPSGGPNYPLATPGVRAAYAITEHLSLSAAVFGGDPAGPGPGTPLSRDPSGTNFKVSDGTFAMAEVAFRTDAIGHHGTGTYKLGAWYHSLAFADQNLDTLGRSLAEPSSSGMPLQHDGNYGFYVVVDQNLWQPGETPDQGLNAFVRASVTPSDRNLLSTYVDAGLSYKGVLRADDTVGLAFSYARIGAAARRFDRTAAIIAPLSPVRDYEANLELTYQVNVAPWWVLQPDLQVVLHPGGNVPLPSSATRAVPNAVAFGARSVMVF